MYDVVDAARMRMDNERRTTEVTSTGEVVKKISNKAVASSAPTPAPVPQRKIKTVRRADLAKPSRLLSAGDVERYVDDLRLPPYAGARCKRRDPYQLTRGATGAKARTGGLWRLERLINHERFCS